METEEMTCQYSGLPSLLAFTTKTAKSPQPDVTLSAIEIDRIIEMAWEDRTPFDAITFQFGLSEAEVKALMKQQLKFSSYKLWRKRVESCKTKHGMRRLNGIDRFKSNMQRTITHNKISKRK